MEQEKPKTQQEVLMDIRSKLQLKRGYGARISKRLKVDRKDVYAVAWGRKKDPKILEALIQEARTSVEGNPYDKLINQYFNNAA